MLIKKPKDGSKKLLRTHSVTNLSMSDTQLYRQYDGTALNNPYTAHKMKGKATLHTEKAPMTTEIYGTEPRVKKSAPPANTRYTKKSQASRPNAFVPIPELGIYTPEQHVLQNGTYAQHCHLREVNNNKKNRTENLQNVDNMSSTTCTSNTNVNSSFNSSFDESVQSFGAQQNKGVLRGFDPGYYGHTQYPPGGVYHSCMDISNVPSSDRDFGTISSHRSHEPDRLAGRQPRGAVNTHDKPARDLDMGDDSKMDPANRSHSLGDLSTGLTFSLVGQKKADSVMSVSDTKRTENVYNDRGKKNDDNKSSEGNSALKHIRERLQRAVINSQNKISSHHLSHSSNNSGFKTVYEDNAPQQSKPPAKDTYPPLEHYSHSPRPHQHHHHSQPQHQQQMQRQQSAPEDYPKPIQSVSSPRRRRDSDDTTSSYRSARSDVRLSQDLDNLPYNYASSSSYNNNNNNMSNSSNSVATLNNSNSSGNSYSTANSQSTITNSQPAPPHSSREKSPVKPKRSLPNVPLSETSERIKRFTEMMKSRMSSSSSVSRNYSADSMSSKHTPSRMSSVESNCSQNSHSRKSSIETASDCEVFTITATNGHHQHHRKPEKFHSNGVGVSKNVTSPPIQQPIPTRLQDGGVQERYYNAKASGSHTNNGRNGYSSYDNRRKSNGNDLDYQDSRSVPDSNNHHHGNQQLPGGGHGYNSYEGQGHTSYSGYGHGRLTSEETPLPPGDRSTDSGQTTGTNHSYNGSALDSGYTTNNDGENDSFNSHHQQHKQPQQHQQHSQPYQTQQSTTHSQQHYHHHPPSSQPQNGQKYNDSNSAVPKFGDQRFNDYYRPGNKYSNLANAHRFGSVQNVSSAQAHGNPRDFSNNQQPFHHENHFQPTQYSKTSYPLSKYDGPFSAREMATVHNTQNGNLQQLPPKSDRHPVNQQCSQSQDFYSQKPASRRSWDYADQHNDGFSDNQLKKFGKTDERYRSTEVISTTRSYNNGNYVNTAHLYNDDPNKNHLNNQSGAISRKFSSEKDNGHSNSGKEFPSQMVHSYHGDLNHQQYNGHNTESSHHSVKSTSYTRDSNSNGSRSQRGDDQWNAEFYRRNNTNNQAQNSGSPSVERVRHRPVPIGRANRLARGHTLPGGFRFGDSDSSLPPLPGSGHEISLFHMTQKYDLAPLLINLPKHMTLKDVLELKEFFVEISMVGVPGLPSSPQGQAPKIGSPGSAFTPVRNSQDQDTSMTARLKVICFAHVWDEIHKHSTLGRVLEGDILIEVNGWFCLGADVVYLKRIVENCQGALTFTVARAKESDEKRFKGQTPAERVKGLEAEISRLDDLIQSRDEKIRELTSSSGSNGTEKQQTGTLSDVNGKIPVEGMVIGDDEYVV